MHMLNKSAMTQIHDTKGKKSYIRFQTLATGVIDMVDPNRGIDHCVPSFLFSNVYSSYASYKS